jgi:transposase
MQLKFFHVLRNRSMAQEIIRDKFSVQPNGASAWRLLKKLGLSSQNPLRRSYQHYSKAVNHSSKEGYLKKHKLAKREKAPNFLADEASARSDYHRETTWAPRGQPPVLLSTGARFILNLASAVCLRGKMRFKAFNSRMSTAKFIEFLQRVTKEAKHPDFLIVNGHSTHRAVEVKMFVAYTKSILRLFFMPPYSSEPNLAKSVWKYVKDRHVVKVTICGPDQFRALALGTLRQIQKMPALVSPFLGQKEPHYITA